MLASSSRTLELLARSGTTVISLIQDGWHTQSEAVGVVRNRLRTIELLATPFPLQCRACSPRFTSYAALFLRIRDAINSVGENEGALLSRADFTLAIIDSHLDPNGGRLWLNDGRYKSDDRFGWPSR